MGIKTINALLKKIVLARLREPGYIKTEIDGLYCYRTDTSKTAERCFYRPKIILVLQGRKLAKIGKNEYVYGENQCLISGVDTPGISYVAEGSRSKPLLTMSLDIDLKVISQLVAEMSLKGVDCRGSYRGIAVSNADDRGDKTGAGNFPRRNKTAAADVFGCAHQRAEGVQSRPQEY